MQSWSLLDVDPLVQGLREREESGRKRRREREEQGWGREGGSGRDRVR